jgi:hypothetical protein
MASVHRDREKWRVKWRDAGGRQHSRTFRTKIDAQGFAATVEADKHRGVGIDPAGARVTFDAYAAAWMTRQVWAPPVFLPPARFSLRSILEFMLKFTRWAMPSALVLGQRYT